MDQVRADRGQRDRRVPGVRGREHLGRAGVLGAGHQRRVHGQGVGDVGSEAGCQGAGHGGGQDGGHGNGQDGGGHGAGSCGHDGVPRRPGRRQTILAYQTGVKTYQAIKEGKDWQTIAWGIAGTAMHAFGAVSSVRAFGRGASEVISEFSAQAKASASYKNGFVDDFVGGTVSKETLDQVRLVSKGIPGLQRSGFRQGLQFIDTGAAKSKYIEELHGILLEAEERAVTRGVLAEELQHAMDVAGGLHSARAITSMKRLYGAAFNNVWHQGVFNRIADALESQETTIFHFFLHPEDAQAFRKAADALGRSI